MKIAIIAPGALPIPATSGGAVESLIDTFLEYASGDEKIEIDVFSSASNLTEEKTWTEKNIRYYQIPHIEKKAGAFDRIIHKLYPQYSYSGFIKYFQKKLDENKYDKVIIENRPLFVSDVLKHTKADIYLHLHNETILSVKGYCKNSIRKCKKVITVSDYIKRTLEKEIPSDNYCVLHNGIDVSAFKKEEDPTRFQAIRKEYGIDKDAFVICYTGRVCREKGVLELVQAFSKLNEISNLTLLIIGSAWFGNNVKDPYIEAVQEASKKCKNKIVFTGYINNKEVARVESIVDVSVIPSIWNDPLPLTVIEAMASGVPVITTVSGGIPEMCLGENGIVLNITSSLSEDIAKAVMELYNDQKKTVLLGLNARKRAEEFFTKERYYRNFVSILQDD